MSINFFKASICALGMIHKLEGLVLYFGIEPGLSSGRSQSKTAIKTALDHFSSVISK